MKDVYQLCAEHFDDDAQLMKTAEEAGELASAICKYLVWKLYKNHPDRAGTVTKTEGELKIGVIKEILDVEVMIDQIKYIPFLDEPSTWNLMNAGVINNLWKKLEDVTGKTPAQLREDQPCTMS